MTQISVPKGKWQIVATLSVTVLLTAMLVSVQIQPAYADVWLTQIILTCSAETSANIHNMELLNNGDIIAAFGATCTDSQVQVFGVGTQQEPTSWHVTEFDVTRDGEVSQCDDQSGTSFPGHVICNTSALIILNSHFE